MSSMVFLILHLLSDGFWCGSRWFEPMRVVDQTWKQRVGAGAVNPFTDFPDIFLTGAGAHLSKRDQTMHRKP